MATYKSVARFSKEKRIRRSYESSFDRREDGYTEDEMFAIAMQIAASAPRRGKHPKDRPSSCVFRLEHVEELINDLDFRVKNFPEYEDRTYYITLFPFRPNPEIKTDVVWSLLFSEKLSSEYFSHRFYSTYGQADEETLHNAAKVHARKISQIISIKEVSDEESDRRFEVKPCLKNPINRNSNLWVIECLRYEYRFIIYGKNKIWTRPEIGEPEPDQTPEQFTPELVFRRKNAVWENLLFHPTYGVPIPDISET